MDRAQRIAMQAAPLAAHLQPASLSGATNAARFRCPYLARPPISARPALRGKRAMDAIDSDDLYVVEQDASESVWNVETSPKQNHIAFHAVADDAQLHLRIDRT